MFLHFLHLLVALIAALAFLIGEGVTLLAAATVLRERVRRGLGGGHGGRRGRRRHGHIVVVVTVVLAGPSAIARAEGHRTGLGERGRGGVANGHRGVTAGAANRVVVRGHRRIVRVALLDLVPHVLRVLHHHALNHRYQAGPRSLGLTVELDLHDSNKVEHKNRRK